jgi:hypothetical protein
MLVALLLMRLDFLLENSSKHDPDVFVGVDIAYDGVDDIKRFVDEVRTYTNLIVIGSTGITYNETKLDDMCQYAYDAGLYFIVYTHPTTNFNQAQWVDDAERRWGNRFLGLYAYDEAGGRQMDRDPYMLVTEADNYTDAANQYVGLLTEHLKHFTDYYIEAGELPLFTSDYALYWFDYKGGYDVVLTEFGWNHSRPLNVALTRGAATVQGKEWGAIVTWTYRSPPYIESGEELFDDLVFAYQNGAKYIAVFNYPKVSTYGILEEEHLEALKRFWSYVNGHPRTTAPTGKRAAYILPKDYGYGFRGPDDKIWGLWESDEFSEKAWNDVNSLLEHHPQNIDIIYEDDIGYNYEQIYHTLILWNGTITK